MVIASIIFAITGVISLAFGVLLWFLFAFTAIMDFFIIKWKDEESQEPQEPKDAENVENTKKTKKAKKEE